jgi:hypothetical protein
MRTSVVGSTISMITNNICICIQSGEIVIIIEFTLMEKTMISIENNMGKCIGFHMDHISVKY